MKNKDIRAGFKQAKKITQDNAKTFYFASLLLPKKQRCASYSVYSICRLTDDSVDKYKGTKKLKQIENQIEKAYSKEPVNDPLLMAFRKTLTEYKIPKEYFDELIKGMDMDLNKNRYQNFEELYDYCYKVAGVIGLIMLCIFKLYDKKSKEYAVNLGIGMQLTNILRDIKQDYRMNRIYLPKDEMDKFNVQEQNIKTSKVDENFISFIRFQIKRSRHYYKISEKGIKAINNKLIRFTVFAMADIYQAILTAIEKNKYDVFKKRAHTTLIEKTILLLKIFFRKR